MDVIAALVADSQVAQEARAFYLGRNPLGGGRISGCLGGPLPGARRPARDCLPQ